MCIRDSISGESESVPYILMYSLATVVPAGLIGGLVAVLTGSKDEVYNFTDANPNAKLKRLKYLIQKHEFWTPMP